MLAAPGYAAFPGLNGKIAFERPGTEMSTLHTISPDGTGEEPLPTANWYPAEPSWSADGQAIAYRCWVNGVCVKTMGGADIEVYEAYGTSTDPSLSPDGSTVVFSEEVESCPDESEPDWCFLQKDLATHSAHTWSCCSTPLGENIWGDETEPSWSPDGSLIAFVGTRISHPPDGTYVPGPGVSGSTPDWSPDGTRLVYSRHDGSDNEIYVVGRDGTGNMQLTNNSVSDQRPAWSPDGSKIAFESDQGDWEILVMKSNGTGVHAVTDNAVDDQDPSWQPLSPTGYPRPAGATPTYAYLVPANQACTAPDRTHGPPLEHASCSGPDQVSQHLTVGTPDANGKGAKSVGYARYGAVSGNPAAPPDEANVNFYMRLTDVRVASDLSDYEGELELRAKIRITDRRSGPGANEPATGQDIEFPVTVPCAATEDTTIGSRCEVATTAEAITPGAVTEGARSIWAFDQTRVYDGGPDGLAATAGQHPVRGPGRCSCRSVTNAHQGESSVARLRYARGLAVFTGLCCVLLVAPHGPRCVSRTEREDRVHQRARGPIRIQRLQREPKRRRRDASHELPRRHLQRSGVVSRRTEARARMSADAHRRTVNLHHERGRERIARPVRLVSRVSRSRRARLVARRLQDHIRCRGGILREPRGSRGLLVPMGRLRHDLRRGPALRQPDVRDILRVLRDEPCLVSGRDHDRVRHLTVQLRTSKRSAPTAASAAASAWPASAPDWSPDGTKLVYSRFVGTFDNDEIFVANADGTGETRLTTNSVHDSRPVWSPDGTKIAFDSNEGGDWEIFVMNRDGSGRHAVTDNTFDDSRPDWQPIPYTGYPRPAGATPTYVSLVPAYPACTAPDRTHGPPLDHAARAAGPDQVSPAPHGRHTRCERQGAPSRSATCATAPPSATPPRRPTRPT